MNDFWLFEGSWDCGQWQPMGLTDRALGSPTHPPLSKLKYAKRNLLPRPQTPKATLSGVMKYSHQHLCLHTRKPSCFNWNDVQMTNRNANAVFLWKGPSWHAPQRCHCSISELSRHIWSYPVAWWQEIPPAISSQLCQERKGGFARRERAGSHL